MNEADLGEVYRRYVTMVRRCAQRVVLDAAAAEDVAQEVFVRYVEHRRRGGDERETGAFLYRMTLNAALTRLRTEKRRRGLLERDGSPSSTQGGRIEERLSLQQVLARVDEDEAQIAVCYYVEGLEQEEIAELLSMQRRTVGRRLDSFRLRARQVLAEGR